jgi:ABC-type Fe3+-siderophore transport system permease subunit
MTLVSAFSSASILSAASEILQRDLKDVLVLIEEDKAKTAKDKEFWERRSPRITAALLTAILAVAAGFQGVLNHRMDYSPLYGDTVGNSPLYTLCELALLTIRKISEWLRGPQLRAA